MKNKILIIIAIITTSVGCSKFLDVDPPSTLTENRITSDALSTYYTGAYNDLTTWFNSYAYPGYRSNLITIDALGQDVVGGNNYGGVRTQYRYLSTNNLTSGYTGVVWGHYYSTIAVCNSGLAVYESIKVPDSKAKITKAQLLALKALCYLDIVRIWQRTYEVAKDLPVCPIYEIVPDVDDAKEGVGLSTVDEVYGVILRDIEESISIFNEVEYNAPTKDFINKNVAYIIGARAYLTKGTKKDGTGVKGDMDKVAEYAFKAQEGMKLMSKDEFKGGFNDMSNPEWMLGLTQTPDNNTMSYALHFLDTRQNSGLSWYKNVLPDPYFKKLFNYGTGYDNGDVRYQLFRTPSTRSLKQVLKLLTYEKFHQNDTRSGDLLYIRVAEAHLMEAEAIVRGGDPKGGKSAQQIIDNLRKTRGASIGHTVDLEFVLKERRRELWGEGFELFDINRTLSKPERKMLDLADFPEYKNIPDSVIIGNKVYPVDKDGNYHNTDDNKYYDKDKKEITGNFIFIQTVFDLKEGHTTLKYADHSDLKADSHYHHFQMPEVEILNNPKINGPLSRR